VKCWLLEGVWYAQIYENVLYCRINSLCNLREAWASRTAIFWGVPGKEVQKTIFGQR
jgi:hypothetical protein